MSSIILLAFYLKDDQHRENSHFDLVSVKSLPKFINFYSLIFWESTHC